MAKALGRRPERGTAEKRSEVVALLRETGARLGRDTLQGLFGDELSRRELEEISGRYRDMVRVRERELRHALEWKGAGMVWAVDFTDAKVDIDGQYPYLLLVRDMASGYEILSLPCEREDAAVVRAAIEHLMATEGVPLVWKSDNGSAFVEGAIKELMEGLGITHLLSPARTPAYNGSRERGGGWLKTRALYLAAREGRAGRWTCDDVDAARHEANEICRPWGPRGQTRGERWRSREAVGDELRARFRARVASGEAEALSRRAPELLTKTLRAAIRRSAIDGALRAEGLLSSHVVSVPSRRSPRRQRKGTNQEGGD